METQVLDYTITLFHPFTLITNVSPDYIHSQLKYLEVMMSVRGSILWSLMILHFVRGKNDILTIKDAEDTLRTEIIVSN